MRKIAAVFMLMLAGLCSLAMGAGAQTPVQPQIIGIHWQWCFQVPDQEFMLNSVKVSKSLGYNAVIPEFGSHLYREGGVSREFFRRYLTACKKNGIEVIMLFNSLDHGERSPAWPARLENGFDLTEEKNYEYLFNLIDKVREDFAAVGLKMNYLHFGLDESEKVMGANAKKSGRKPADLMLAHIRRLNDFCRKQGCRMIMWHDMLMGEKGTDPASFNECNYSYSVRADAWKCRKDIPRDVILMYWNYEPGTFREPVALAKEGFEVWLMPWGDTNAAAMLKQARKDNFKGMILSTWMESGYYPEETPPTSNSIPCNDWMTAAIGAAVGRTPKEVVNAFFPVPEKAGKNIFMAETPGQVKALGTTMQGTNLEKLVLPLYVVSGSQKEKIDAVNTQRGGNQLVCYTPEFGTGTKCNGFGQEISVGSGVVIARSTWGVGNSAIPGNGFVLSGHGTASRKILNLRNGDKVSVVDSRGTELTAAKVNNGAEMNFQVAGKAAMVECQWAMDAEVPLDGKVLATLIINYADGTSVVHELKAGRDILNMDSHKMFWGRRQDVQVWHTAEGFTGWRWRNSAPGKAIASLTLKMTRPEEMGFRVKSIALVE